MFALLGGGGLDVWHYCQPCEFGTFLDAIGGVLSILVCASTTLSCTCD
jgi:hypothetical protein